MGEPLPVLVLNSEALPQTAMNETRSNPSNAVASESAPASASTEVSDERLMLAFSQGSSDAFTELFSRYKQPIDGFFRRRVAEPAPAEELTQETFFALQRTGKISDVLSVEQEIARVRGEIEQMEAEQQTLEHRVNFATIDLKLAEEYKAQLNSPAPSVASQVRNASVNGFRNAFESLLALILFFAEAAPTLLLWLTFLSVPAWFFWRRYRRSLAVS